MVRSSLTRTILNPSGSSFQGPRALTRPQGSSIPSIDTGRGTEVAEFLSTLEWEDVASEAEAGKVRLGAARYYRATLPNNNPGLEGIALVSELTDDQLSRVEVDEGHHGNIELTLEMDAKSTSTVHIIVADICSGWPPTREPTTNTAYTVTWYPGRLTASVVIPKETAALEGKGEELVAALRRYPNATVKMAR